MGSQRAEKIEIILNYILATAWFISSWKHMEYGSSYFKHIYIYCQTETNTAKVKQTQMSDKDLLPRPWKVE